MKASELEHGKAYNCTMDGNLGIERTCIVPLAADAKTKQRFIVMGANKLQKENLDFFRRLLAMSFQEIIDEDIDGGPDRRWRSYVWRFALDEQGSLYYEQYDCYLNDFTPANKMTTEQESQFNKFGCIPRCLINLAEKIQKPITKQEFCDRFAHRFHNPQTQYGLLNPDYIPEIARALSLPGAKGSVSTELAFVEDYDKVAVLHRTGSLVLIESRINLNEGATDSVGHCSVLQEIDAESFTLWTPSQDGKDYVLQPFPKTHWVAKQCRGMVFL